MVTTFLYIIVLYVTHSLLINLTLNQLLKSNKLLCPSNFYSLFHQENNISKAIFYEVLDNYPDIRLYHNVLLEGEAEYLIKVASKYISQSKVVSNNGAEIYKKTRTSSSAFLNRHHDAKVIEIENRFATLLNTTVIRLEHFQVVNYKKGERFKEHRDTFTEEYQKVQKGQR